MSVIERSSPQDGANLLMAGESIERLTFARLFGEHGPLVGIDAVATELGFNSRDSFRRAVRTRRVPLKIIRPTGRYKAFVATTELARYLAQLSQQT